MLKVALSIFIVFSFHSVSFAKTRVAVSTFKDKSGRGRCRLRGWGRKLSTGFRDQITTALMKTRKVIVVERENLRKMHSEEHELINADKSTQPRKNKFKAAHYSITGAITQFEMCASGLGGKVDVGGLFGMKKSGLNVGGSRATAKVGLDMRIIDTETGEVIASFDAEGESSKIGFDIDGDYKGADFSTGAFKASPIGKATQIAIRKAVKEILREIPLNKKDPSRVASNKTSSRSSKTRKRGRSRGTQNARSKNSAVLQSGQSRISHVCQLRDSWDGDHVACKILSVSATGKRIKVLDQFRGKTQTIEPRLIFTVQKGFGTPKIGSKYLVNTVESGLSTYNANKKKKLFKECLISDAFDGEYVFNCKGKEHTVSINHLYKKQSYVPRKTASQK